MVVAGGAERAGLGKEERLGLGMGEEEKAKGRRSLID